MMASSLPLVTTGLRRPPSSMPSNGQLNSDPLHWCAWAHQGHRLWACMPDSFWVFTYKVERCPFPGTHVWPSCPYAHRGERARRRHPTRFPYAAVACPEFEDSRRRLRLAGSSAAPSCPRGVQCGYAHGVFEMWLHPTRFRTEMCDRGAACPRPVCFFAHCPAQRRREDEEVPLVVFRAAQPPAMPAAAFFVPRAPPRLAASAAVVSRPVDRVAEAVQQGHTVRLLTRRSDAAGGASSSSSSSLAAVAAATAPVDDEDMDFVAIVTRCCLASEADSNAEGSGYPHFVRLVMDIVRR